MKMKLQTASQNRVKVIYKVIPYRYRHLIKSPYLLPNGCQKLDKA